MRSGLDAPTKALYESGIFDAHWKLTVENGSGTQINMEGRYKALNLQLPNPNEPIGSLAVTFIRETSSGGDSTSLAPTIVASAFNKLDDATTFRPLLQLGRIVILEVALTAVGGARPADASLLWFEIFRGIVTDVAWPKFESHLITIQCNGIGGILQLTKSESEFTYTAGTSIETVAREILDNNGHAGVVLNFSIPTGAVLPNDFAPGVQKTVWSQLWALAQSLGWITYYRYQGNGGPELTFFPPERDKTIPDHSVPVWWDYNALEINEEEVRNVGFVQFFNTLGDQERIGPAEDAASITKYGGSSGIRRSFWIALKKDSPVRSLVPATQLLNAALQDVADPDVIATVRTFPLVFSESGVDLLTFPTKGVLFDSDQILAPFNVSVVVDTNRAISEAGVRGLPTAGLRTWQSLDTTFEIALIEDAASAAIEGFVEINRDATTIFYKALGGWGGRITSVKIHRNRLKQPLTTEQLDMGLPWESFPGGAEQEITDPNATISFPIPPSEHIDYILIVPTTADPLINGPSIALIHQPDVDARDRVVSLSAAVDHSDGSVDVRVEVVSTTLSVRTATSVGVVGIVTPPTDAAVEAGTTRTPTGSILTFSLPAGTVSPGEEITLRVAPYANADGTGVFGVTAHGDIVGTTAKRSQFRPATLESTFWDETGDQGTHGVTVHNPDGIAAVLNVRTKSGENVPGAFTLKANPALEIEYQQAVTMVEGHQSFVEWSLESDLGDGNIVFSTLESAGFDFGTVPKAVLVPRASEDLGTASVAVVGDGDQASIWLRAFKNTTYPTSVEALAGVNVVGKNITPETVGDLLTGLVPGDILFFTGVPIGRDGKQSDPVFASIIFAGITPVPRITTNTETAGGGGQFGVTFEDPSGQLTLLRFRTLIGEDATAFVTKASPPISGVENLESVAGAEGKNSRIEYEYTYTLYGQTFVLQIISPAYDPGHIPQVINASAVVQTVGGLVRVGVSTDFDGNEAYVLASKTAFPTSVATVVASGSLIVGGQGEVVNPALDTGGLLGAVLDEESAFISVVARNTLKSVNSTGVTFVPIEHSKGFRGLSVLATALWKFTATGWFPEVVLSGATRAESARLTLDGTTLNVDMTPGQTQTIQFTDAEVAFGSGPHNLTVIGYALDAQNDTEGSETRVFNVGSPGARGEGLEVQDFTGASQDFVKLVLTPTLSIDAGGLIGVRNAISKGAIPSTFAPAFVDGATQQISITGDITVTAATGLVAGDSLDLLITGTGVVTFSGYSLPNGVAQFDAPVFCTIKQWIGVLSVHASGS